MLRRQLRGNSSLQAAGENLPRKQFVLFLREFEGKGANGGAERRDDVVKILFEWILFIVLLIVVLFALLEIGK